MPLDNDTLAQGAANAATAALSKADLLLTIGKFLYQYVTDPQPLDDHETKKERQDLRRYKHMCATYHSVLAKADLPREWELKNNCPTYASELTHSADVFKTQVERLRYSDGVPQTIIIKIISSISRLYESLAKRSWSTSANTYRNDGYEAMFFAELAQWLSTELAGAPITSHNTEIMLGKRIEYCQKIHDEVFVWRDDANLHNPKERLARIIENLKELRKDILKSIEAASFNDLISLIDNNLLTMARDSFDVCYETLDGVNQADLQVDEFLRPNPVDHKVIDLKKLVLGQWIEFTLKAAGITSNNFEGNNDLIDMDMIEKHLSFDFKKINISAYGFPSFIVKNEELATEVLQKLVELHRAILNVYFVRKSLFNAARVGVNFGENWLYGNEDGRTVISALLFITKDASNRLNHAMGEFWKAYYDEGYVKNTPLLQQDTKHETYIYLCTAKARIKQITLSNQNVETSLIDLGKKAQKHADDPNIIKQTKQRLISSLYEYARRKKGIDPSLTDSLKKLSEKEVASTTVNQMQLILHPVAIEPHIIRFPKAELPIYLQANSLLKLKAPLSEINLQLMAEPEKFHTDIQKRVYHDFLKKYHELANATFIFSWIKSLTWFDMDKFKNFYSRINIIMHRLYSKEMTDKKTNPGPKIQKSKPDPYAVPEYVFAAELSQSCMNETNWLLVQKYKMEKACLNAELALVDQLFQIGMFNFSNDFGSPFNFLTKEENFEVLKVKEYGENLEISIDVNLLDYAGGAFAMQLDALEKALTSERQEHQKTREALKLEITERAKEQEKALEFQRDTSERLKSQDELIKQLRAQVQEVEDKFSQHSNAANANGFFHHNQSAGSSAAKGFTI